MKLENPLTFVRAIKGAPASILWALFFTKRTMTALELYRWTGYRDEAITEGLRLLCDLGWITAHGPRGPWSLSGGRQLPLTNLEGLEDSASPVFPESGFSGLTRSRSEIKINVPSYLPLDPLKEHESGLTGLVAENLKALDECEIREPGRSRLASLEHVTPEFIRAHVDGAKAEGLQLGAAIYRIQNNWKAPEPKTKARIVTTGQGKRQQTITIPEDLDQSVANFTGHKLACTCLDCTVGRTRGLSSLCETCRRFNCECEES